MLTFSLHFFKLVLQCKCITFWKMLTTCCKISVTCIVFGKDNWSIDLQIYFSLVCPFARLSAGCDQTYHLTGRTQDRRPGRGQHSHRVERCPRGLGVPTQERTDPQVGFLPHCSSHKSNTFFFFTTEVHMVYYALSLKEKCTPPTGCLCSVASLTRVLTLTETPGNIVFLKWTLWG